MDTIQKIKHKILKEAKDEIDEINKAANEEISALKTDNKEKIKQFKLDYDEETVKIADQLKQKEMAKARLEAKKEIISKREAIINDMVDDSIGKVRTQKDYDKFLKSLIDKNIKLLDVDLEVDCNKNDAPKVKKIVAKAKINNADIMGGVVLKDGSGKKMDFSVESVLEGRIPEIKRKVLKIIGG